MFSKEYQSIHSEVQNLYGPLRLVGYDSGNLPEHRSLAGSRLDRRSCAETVQSLFRACSEPVQSLFRASLVLTEKLLLLSGKSSSRSGILSGNRLASSASDRKKVAANGGPAQFDALNFPEISRFLTAAASAGSVFVSFDTLSRSRA